MKVNQPISEERGAQITQAAELVAFVKIRRDALGVRALQDERR
jgi:hypothetical protein